MNFEVRVEGLEGPDLRTRGRRWPRHQVSASQGRDKTLGDEEACWQQMLGFGTEASQTGPDVFVRCDDRQAWLGQHRRRRCTERCGHGLVAA